MNSNGVAVGYDDTGSWITSNCSTTIDYPGARTYLTGINDSGTGVGYAVNAADGYSFMLPL